MHAPRVTNCQVPHVILPTNVASFTHHGTIKYFMVPPETPSTELTIARTVLGNMSEFVAHIAA